MKQKQCELLEADQCVMAPHAQAMQKEREATKQYNAAATNAGSILVFGKGTHVLESAAAALLTKQ